MVYLNKCKYVCGYVVLNNASSDRVGLWEQFFMWNPMTFLSYKFNVQNLALPLIKFCVAVYAVALFQYISDVCNDKFTFKLIYVLKIINLFWFFFLIFTLLGCPKECRLLRQHWTQTRVVCVKLWIYIKSQFVCPLHQN